MSACQPSWQKLSYLAEIIWERSYSFVTNWNNLAKIMQFCHELQLLYKISKGLQWCFSLNFSYKVYKGEKVIDFNAISLRIASLILMAMLQKPALSQKVLKDRVFRLPERQELFPGLLRRSLRWMSSTNVTYLQQQEKTNIKGWAELCHTWT